MSGLGSCRKCGANVHWYQTARRTTHPPLDMIKGETLVISEQVVAPRNTYTTHSCRAIDRDVFDLQKEERHGVPPALSSMNQQQVKARFWFAQVIIDLAERHPCPQCNAPAHGACENMDWTFGHFTEPRFADEPCADRVALVAPGDQPVWTGPTTFTYVSASSGESTFAIDPNGTLRVWR